MCKCIIGTKDVDWWVMSRMQVSIGDNGLNYPDKCKDHFSLSDLDLLALYSGESKAAGQCIFVQVSSPAKQTHILQSFINMSPSSAENRSPWLKTLQGRYEHKISGFSTLNSRIQKFTEFELFFNASKNPTLQDNGNTTPCPSSEWLEFDAK